jgi:hypothetical protein
MSTSVIHARPEAPLQLEHDYLSCYVVANARDTISEDIDRKKEPRSTKDRTRYDIVMEAEPQKNSKRD